MEVEPVCGREAKREPKDEILTVARDLVESQKCEKILEARVGIEPLMLF